MYTLGINAYHGDSAASIYLDAVLISATEEERFTRIKHWAGLPISAIQFCLKEAGISLDKIDYITISRDPKAHIEKKLLRTFTNISALKSVINRGANALKIQGIKKEICNALGFKESEVKAELIFVEHHRSHMASAFYISPFEEAAILSIDGMGDFTSTMSGIGKNNTIEVLDTVHYPHSLGFFYTAFTQYLGFPFYGDEYKVMGLSPYGTPRMTDKILGKIINYAQNTFSLNPEYFRHFKEGVSMSWKGGSPHVEPLFSSEFVYDFGPVRDKNEPLTEYHKDLAASVQRVTEKIIFHMAESLYRKTKIKNLCIAGGVAQNSVANGKLVQETSFEKLFVPPAGHDAGTAAGSALYHIHHKLNTARRSYMPQPYTGAKFSSIEIEKIIKNAGKEYKRYSDINLTEYIAHKLVQGAVVGWFQGRAEFGPRALGNRSILVDPRRTDAKQLLNEKIKKRESFRPFAPSILTGICGRVL